MKEKKRARINGTFRWREQQTKDLLTIIADKVQANPDLFEKPTAQKFYERIAENAPNLKHIKWDIMRTKMRHLKTSFLSALKWKEQHDAGLLENGDVIEYIKRMCPFYDELHAIFRERINMQPSFVFQSTESISSPLQYNGADNNETEMSIVLDMDATTSSTLASATDTLPPASSENMMDSSATFKPNNVTTPKIDLKRPRDSSSSFALLYEFQKNLLELEKQKLDFEKEKEANSFKLQKLRLEKEERVEMEKIRLEHERLKSLNSS
ncbi:PREDICTED: uncharacterized protein LOC108976119 [Bactrocera latifrons]|uniref:uncharacterized protein LOC108976119 n=1 Tax=Bactrocera latifrons TaxID=174628 RepID=UPI0008DC76D0|nr:PREDICTED: uncharacterized protein LOC108976119 [Bactrocera latifrons]